MPDGTLVGFVNVAWDGAEHAFLLDTKTRPSHQRRGIGTAVVRRAMEEARAAGSLANTPTASRWRQDSIHCRPQGFVRQRFPTNEGAVEHHTPQQPHGVIDRERREVSP